MTVSSLWAVLDDAGCGRAVGIDDFNLRGRDERHDQQSILAVDLSIWICEGITSTALSSFHSDPALHLVYQRTNKLLKLGLGLVFVAEGKRRVRSETTSSSSSSDTHELKQRRSGSQFWNASKRCEEMLQCLGVPVVRAEAEGEALCALLNLKGLVDGVISNDGDCLLFGAKTIYTGFSAENIEARKVMRYDSENLVANLNGGSSRTIKLSREDLIAFAMLSGSDMVGSGVPHVGGSKAVQFLKCCRNIKHPCSLDELLSWAAVAPTSSKDKCFECDDDGPITIPTRCCSICLHPGDKGQHEKYGCKECGTGPGEGCYVVTSSQKFLRSLKEKALGLIAPRPIINGYFSPNSNNIPNSLLSLKSAPYALPTDAAKLFATSLILKGRSKESSQEYIRQTLPKLLARLDLWDTRPRNRYATTKQKYKPIPVRIEKSLVKQSWPCYEVMWAINIHPSTEDDQLQFSTCECQSLLNSNFPQLVKAHHQEKRRKQQGRAEDDRRKRFVGTNKQAHRRNQSQRRDLSKKLQKPGHRRKRERNFDVTMPKKAQKMSSKQAPSHDVSMLMGNLQSDEFDEDGLETPVKSDGNGCSNPFIHDTHQDDTISMKGPIKDSDMPTDMRIEDDMANCHDSDSNKDEGCHHSNDGHLSLEDDIFGGRNWDDDELVTGKERSRLIDEIIYDDGDHHSNDPTQPILQDALDLNNSSPGDTSMHFNDCQYGLKACKDRTNPELRQPYPPYPHQEGHIHVDGTTGGRALDEMRNPTANFANDNELGSGVLKQNSNSNEQMKGSQNRHLSPSTRLFCDMGIQIEVTPIVSRRYRFF